MRSSSCFTLYWCCVTVSLRGWACSRERCLHTGLWGFLGFLKHRLSLWFWPRGWRRKKPAFEVVGSNNKTHWYPINNVWLLTSTSTLQPKKQPSTSDGGVSHHINMYCMYFTEKVRANVHHRGGGFSPLLSGREAVAVCTHSHPACTHGWTGFVYKRLERAQNHNRDEVWCDAQP